MAWIFKVEKPAATGNGTVTEYVGSGIPDEAAAHEHVRTESPTVAQIYTVAKITDAELLECGVPAGRTQVIQYTGELGDRRAAEKKMNAEAFLREWVADNAEPTSDDDVSTPRTLTSKCFAEASNRGIDVDELSAAAGGDVEAFITKSMNATPAESQHQRQ